MLLFNKGNIRYSSTEPVKQKEVLSPMLMHSVTNRYEAEDWQQHDKVKSQAAVKMDKIDHLEEVEKELVVFKKELCLSFFFHPQVII